MIQCSKGLRGLAVTDKTDQYYNAHKEHGCQTENRILCDLIFL